MSASNGADGAEAATAIITTIISGIIILIGLSFMLGVVLAIV